MVLLVIAGVLLLALLCMAGLYNSLV